VDRLTTALASRQILHPSGTSFAASKTAQEIFDSRNPDDSLATDNVFAAVHGLQVALAGNDQAGIASSLAALGSAEDRLNIQLAFYGTVQDKIADANDYAGKLDVRLQTELSSRRDADAVEAITELQRGQTQQQAALTARAQLPRSSLFDFLK
jgi:flagellin-like hook-associated protein FlgL